MRRVNIAYWTFSGLLAVWAILAGIPDLLSVPQAVTLFERLGYPLYLLPFLGVAKLLAAVVILLPGVVRLREWAYAGLGFDFTGALYSHLCVGDSVSEWWGAVMGLLLLAGSYLLYHRRLIAAHPELRTVDGSH